MNVKMVHVIKMPPVQIVQDITIAAAMKASTETDLIVEVLLQFRWRRIFLYILQIIDSGADNIDFVWVIIVF